MYHTYSESSGIVRVFDPNFLTVLFDYPFFRCVQPEQNTHKS